MTPPNTGGPSRWQLFAWMSAIGLYGVGASFAARPAAMILRHGLSDASLGTLARSAVGLVLLCVACWAMARVLREETRRRLTTTAVWTSVFIVMVSLIIGRAVTPGVAVVTWCCGVALGAVYVVAVRGKHRGGAGSDEPPVTG